MAARRFSLATGFPENPLIAVDVAVSEGVLDSLTTAFAAAWDVTCAPRWEIDLPWRSGFPGRTRLEVMRLLFVEEPEVLEELCEVFVLEAESNGLASKGRFDSVGLVQFLRSLVSVDAAPALLSLPAIEYFRHNWKIRRYYHDHGLIFLIPFYCLIFDGLPSLDDIQECYTLVGDLEEGRVASGALSDVLLSVSLADRHRVKEFLIFLVMNSPLLAITDDRGCQIITQISSRYPSFLLYSYNFLHSRSVRWKGVDLRSGVDPRSVHVDLHLEKVAEFFNSLSSNNNGPIGYDEIAIKGAMLSREEEGKSQGIGRSLRAFLIQQIEARGDVLRWRDIKSKYNLNSSIDPFDIDPGRLCVYAPGERFLSEETMMLALRDWVEDQAHKRSRISADRILTPLSNVSIPSENELSLVIGQWPSNIALDFIDPAQVISYLSRRVPQQSIRWFARRLARRLDRVLLGAGYTRVGEAYVKPTWLGPGLDGFRREDLARKRAEASTSADRALLEHLSVLSASRSFSEL